MSNGDGSRDHLFGTAGWHSTREIPVAAPGERVDEVFRALWGRRFDSAAVVAVCDGDRLLGLVALERLLAAPAGTAIEEVMDIDPPVVAPGLRQEHAAWKAVQHGELGLATVDPDNRFAGLIPARRLLRVLLEEHDEDMARLGGFLRSRARARAASEEGVWRRLWHRTPWLGLGLVGAMLSAWLLEGFEGKLEAHIAVSFFLPGIVYLADAVGTQTETLSIRGLSVGVGIGRIAVREALTGLLVGVLMAAVTAPIVAVWQGDAALAVSVALAVLAASTVATLVAMALPWVLQRFGRDPAFGSGPLATVIQDLLTIIIYLVIVSALLIG